LYVPTIVGEPVIVTVVPDTAKLTPGGNPETVALVAEPPIEYVIGAMAVLIQTV
jgi:hypothetical protein